MSLISYFSSKKSTLVYKYLNHGILMCPFQVFIIFLYLNFNFIKSNSKFNSNLILKHSQFYYFNPYVGSSIELSNRFTRYFNRSYLKSNNYVISKALLKYGYEKFTL